MSGLLGVAVEQLRNVRGCYDYSGVNNVVEGFYVSVHA